LTGLAWQTTLHIAVAYGWEPLGTVNCHLADWSGSYLYGEGQTLTDKDAINFANALSRNVADRFQKLNGTDLENVLIERKGSAKFLKRVISYVKRGSFNIDPQQLKDFCMFVEDGSLIFRDASLIVKDALQIGGRTLH